QSSPETPDGMWPETWRLLLAAGIGAFVWLTRADDLSPSIDDGLRNWFLIGDPLVAVACLALVRLRRRHPFPIAAILIVVATTSFAASGAVLLALCSLATRRRYAETAAIAVAGVLTGLLSDQLYPTQSMTPWWYAFTVLIVSTLASVAIGFAIGAR